MRLWFSSEIWKLFRHNSLPSFLHLPLPWSVSGYSCPGLLELPGAHKCFVHFPIVPFFCASSAGWFPSPLYDSFWHCFCFFVVVGFLFLILFVCFLRQGLILDPGWPSIFYGTQANSLESTTPLPDRSAHQGYTSCFLACIWDRMAGIFNFVLMNPWVLFFCCYCKAKSHVDQNGLRLTRYQRITLNF